MAVGFFNHRKYLLYQKYSWYISFGYLKCTNIGETSLFFGKHLYKKEKTTQQHLNDLLPERNQPLRELRSYNY